MAGISVGATGRSPPVERRLGLAGSPQRLVFWRLPIRLLELRLTNFRSYEQLDWNVPAGWIVIEGDNAQGKTNLLEAIYCLATTKSHRTPFDRELINWHAARDPMPVARIWGNVERRADHVEIEVALRGEAPGRPSAASQAGSSPVNDSHSAGDDVPFLALPPTVQKRLRVNSVVRRASGVIGQVTVVLFSPTDVDLVSGAPALRRRYLDATISQSDSAYLRHLQLYGRVLVQRNALLRRIREGRAQSAELAYWDAELAASGGYLVWRRQEVMQALHDLAEGIHQQLTDGEEKLVVSYAPAGRLDGDLDGTRAALAQALADGLARDVAQGMTLVGPHRDDLLFVSNGVPLGTFGSRGQQRTLALTLRLAEAEYLARARDDASLLLLDDILSELDARRRRLLLSFLHPYQQVFITATELHGFPADWLAGARVFRAEQGSLTAV